MFSFFKRKAKRLTFAREFPSRRRVREAARVLGNIPTNSARNQHQHPQHHLPVWRRRCGSGGRVCATALRSERGETPPPVPPLAEEGGDRGCPPPHTHVCLHIAGQVESGDKWKILVVCCFFFLSQHHVSASCLLVHTK